jgi:hypothetical protein
MVIPLCLVPAGHPLAKGVLQEPCQIEKMAEMRGFRHEMAI